MLNQNEYYAWAWTPHFVAQMLKAEQEASTGLILPDRPSEQEAPALCHFSVLRDGFEYSWLWLFKDMPQAVALRLMPQVLPDDDPVADLIQATIPNRSPGEPAKTYIQTVPVRWFLREIDLEDLGISEVWFGFDYRQFSKTQDLRSAAHHILGADEFVEDLRRSAVV